MQLDYAGSFRLVRTIADGGMARVYEAEQLGPAGFAKRIALKVIHPELVTRPGFLRLFTDEAKLSANLLHGNIVQIYQLGQVGGDFFIAMELIRGPSLRELVDRHRELGQPIPTTLAAYVGSRVCRALDFAHHFVGHDGIALDIVHRDVSPGNVMITWDGHIKLADFGIAKARTMADPDDAGELVMGKKRYMSPEQLLGLEVEAPSDVFSLGCVLFELLSLDPLFTEEGTAQMIRDVAVNPLPSLRERVRDLDPELEQILEMALAREAALRPTAAAMGHALDRWLAGQRAFGTPDTLEAHLAAIFPQAYAPPTRTGEHVTFTHLKAVPAAAKRGWMARLLGRGT